MKNLKIINILSLLLFVSCSSTNLTDEQRRIFKRKKTTYNLTDHSGQFTVIRESGLRKNKRDLVNRVTIYPEKKIGQRPLEQSATVFYTWNVKKRFCIEAKYVEILCLV